MYLVSRTETFAKLFFIVSFTGLFMYVALAFYSFHTAYSAVSQIQKKYDEQFSKQRSYDTIEDRFEEDLKYILVWSADEPEQRLPYEGQSTFIQNNCPEINCYITKNKTILNGDYSNFDAIVFNLSLQWSSRSFAKLPKIRKERQKYVFYGMEASDDHPVCNVRLDNFFNWTWSYKFYSDIFNPFIEVKDLKGKVVAPSRNVIWANHLELATKSDIEQVNTKTKAIAWILEDCTLKINKMLIIPKLKKALRAFNLSLDVYGCGYLKCPVGGCLKAIERDYYFVMVFEGSMSEDYVTAQVLNGYHHDAVPIVVGGADYTKFLPENSYINFQYYTEEKLAALVDYTIKNPKAYIDYFNWKKHYTINKVEEFRGYCDLCKLLNDKKKYQSISTYEKFRSWWYYGSLKDKCLPKGAERVEEIKAYMNESARF